VLYLLDIGYFKNPTEVQPVDSNNQVDISTILQSVASQLQQNQSQLNAVDNSGTHGQRIADAFAAAASAAQNAGTNDAGQQLLKAAQAMQQQGQGKAASFYAQGLAHAAEQFKGQSGISTNDLAPFLQSFLGGVKKNNPAKPGQGTILDALSPAESAFTQAQNSGGNTEQAMAQALGAAINGTASTGSQGNVDPGAASVTNVLGGIFAALAPQLLAMLMNSRGQGQGATQGSGGFDIGGLLSGLASGSGAGSQATQPGGQLGWLTGLLGGMANNSGMGSGSGGVDVGGLLNGLMGGGAAGGSGSSGQGNVDLGSLLNDFTGGSNQGRTQ
jgi:phosphoenolpyruvate---glycerone phosphotransferase subunit DhaL